MTPTTAEQMPDWYLIDTAMRSIAILNRAEREKMLHQCDVLQSWLAQGGARGGEALQELIDDVNHAKGFLIGYGGPAKTAADFLRDAAAKAIAALAPRAEAGEAVLTNPHTGTPRDYRDVESDPEGILIAVPGEPLRPYKPTAACGVSGLVGKWPEADPVTDPTWRISPKFLISVMDNAEEPVSMEQVEAVLLAATRLFNECTPELEAALKANMGGVSDEPVAWEYQHAETGRSSALINDGVNNPSNFAENNPRLIYVGPLYRHAALNAGALAGGEVVAWQYKGWTGEWRECDKLMFDILNGRGDTPVRSLVVGGVGS